VRRLLGTWLNLRNVLRKCSDLGWCII